MSINTVVIVGNLTRDPELKTTKGGSTIASLRVAVNDRVKDASGNWTDRANYFDVDAFGRTAELCGQYLSRGKQVAVRGALRWREWEAKDGTKRQAVSIAAHDVQFIGAKDGSAKAAMNQADDNTDFWPDDDPPF